jgi:hypothetical protein
MRHPLYYRSPLHHLANQTLEWLPMDTEERYKDNLKHKKRLLKQNGWVDKKVTYKFNSQGFRCDEFETDTDCAVFLGCSHTMGIGLPVDAVWPSLVAAELKLKCYNLGIGGSSNDTAFRLGYHYIPKLKPKVVVLLSPDSNRFEIYNKEKTFTSHGPWSDTPFYREWALRHENGIINQEKNALALKAICDANHAQYIRFSITDFYRTDLARDLAHYGVKTNLQFSKTVLKLIDTSKI